MLVKSSLLFVYVISGVLCLLKRSRLLRCRRIWKHLSCSSMLHLLVVLLDILHMVDMRPSLLHILFLTLLTLLEMIHLRITSSMHYYLTCLLK